MAKEHRLITAVMRIVPFSLHFPQRFHLEYQETWKKEEDMRGRFFLVVFLSAYISGCGESTNVPHGIVDASNQVDQNITLDVPLIDAAKDAAADAPNDVTVDLPLDGGADLSFDAGTDMVADLGADINVDAAADSSMDLGLDAIVDSNIDGGVDASMDSAVDTGVDAGPDVGADTGTGSDAALGLSLSNPQAAPDRVRNTNESSVLSVTVTSSAAAVSSVTVDLSQLGLSATQAMNDSGTDGDLLAGDGIYSCTVTADGMVTPADYSLTISASDALANSAADEVVLTVQGPRTLTMLSASSGAGNLPAPRQKAGVAYDPQGDRMLVYSGRILGKYFGEVVDDVWAYDLGATTKVWSEIKPAAAGPSGRFAATAFVDLPRNRLIIGGGGNFDVAVSDAWYFNLTPEGTEAWTKIADFFFFYGGEVLAYDAVNDRAVMVGDSLCAFDTGDSKDPRQVDLTTDTGSYLGVSGTAPTWGCAIGAHDPNNHRLVLIGDNSNAVDQIDLTAGSEAWGQITAGVVQPPAFTTSAAAVATTPGGRVFMYVLGNSWNEIWRLDLTSVGAESWAQLPLTGTAPSDPRSHFGLIYDAARNRLVVFGGSSYVAGTGTTFYNDVWEIANIDD